MMSTKFLNKKTSLTILVAVLVIVSGAFMAFSQIGPTHVVIDGLLEKTDPQKLARESQHVIIGTVEKSFIEEVESDPFRKGDPMVWTYYVIDVESDLKNTYNGKQITIKTHGGKTENYWIESFISPKFDVDEKVLLFVSKEPDSEMGNDYFIWAHKNGAYKIRDNNVYGKEYPDGIYIDSFINEISSELS